MNKAALLLVMVPAFLLVLLGAVMQTPDFITVNFTVVWFVMVLVIMTASLALLASGLSEPKKAPKAHSADKGDEKPKSAH